MVILGKREAVRPAGARVMGSALYADEYLEPVKYKGQLFHVRAMDAMQADEVLAAMGSDDGDPVAYVTRLSAVQRRIVSQCLQGERHAAKVAELGGDYDKAGALLPPGFLKLAFQSVAKASGMGAELAGLMPDGEAQEDVPGN
jgi:hypothetical protein